MQTKNNIVKAKEQKFKDDMKYILSLLMLMSVCEEGKAYQLRKAILVKTIWQTK
jgi:hypothetical protein